MLWELFPKVTMQSLKTNARGYYDFGFKCFDPLFECWYVFIWEIVRTQIDSCWNTFDASWHIARDSAW